MSFNNQYRPGRFGGLPVVTKNIIIINVIVFALTYIAETQNINLYKYLALHHHSAPDFKPHQFITYLFMHGGLMHLALNMLGVYMFGQVLEQLWGPKRYLIFYIATGLGAALTQYVIIHLSVAPFVDAVQQVQDHLTIKTFEEFVSRPDFQDRLTGSFAYDYNIFVNQYNSTVNENPAKALGLASQFLVDYKNNYLNANVVVGASGSLFGLLGAFGMLFPNQMLYIYFLFPVKAKWLVIAYGAFELFSGISNNPNDNVAHFAHLGGLFVGIILVLLWRRNRTHFY